jgi:hypothetical protein
MPASTCRRSSRIPRGWLRRAWRPEPSRFLRTSGSALHSHPECSTRPSPGYPPRRHRCTGRTPAESPAVARRSPSCRPWCCLHRCTRRYPDLGGEGIICPLRLGSQAIRLRACHSGPKLTPIHQGVSVASDIVQGIRKNLEMDGVGRDSDCRWADELRLDPPATSGRKDIRRLRGQQRGELPTGCVAENRR